QRLEIVYSDAFSEEKGLAMRALGAVLTIVPSGAGGITESLMKAMIHVAGDLSRRPGHWWCDQLHNEDAVRGYHSLGDELLAQTGGNLEAPGERGGAAHP